MHLSTSLAPTSLKTTLYLHLWFRCQTCLWLWFVSQIPALPQSVRQPAPDIYTLSGLVQQEEHYSLKTWNKINKYISIFYSNNLDLSILTEIFLYLHTSISECFRTIKRSHLKFKYQNLNSLLSQTFLSIQQLHVPYFTDNKTILFFSQRHY